MSIGRLGLDSVADPTISCKLMGSVEATEVRPVADRLISLTEPQIHADLAFDCKKRSENVLLYVYIIRFHYFLFRP